MMNYFNINTEGIFFKVHLVPLRNFKQVSLPYIDIQMAATGLFKASFCFKFV